MLYYFRQDLGLSHLILNRTVCPNLTENINFSIVISQDGLKLICRKFKMVLLGKKYYKISKHSSVLML